MSANCPTCGKKLPATKEDRRKAASKAGLARSAALTPERRKEIALKAVRTRWKNNSCTDAEGM